MQRRSRNLLPRHLLGVAVILATFGVNGSSQTLCAPATPSPSRARPSEIWVTASLATRVCFSPSPSGWEDNCFQTASLPRSRSIPAGRYSVEFTAILPGRTEVRTESLNTCDSGRCAFHYDWNSHTLETR